MNHDRLVSQKENSCRKAAPGAEGNLMMIRNLRWFRLIVVVCACFWADASSAAAQVGSASLLFPEIKLEDQFRTAHTPDSLFALASSGQALVLIGGDQRRTDDQIRNWANRLKTALGERVRCVGLANLRGLPFFVSKNSVRSSLKKKLSDVLVLCDWNGAGFKQFALVRRQVNVLVYSRTRTLVGTVTGNPDEERVKAVTALVERAAMQK